MTNGALQTISAIAFGMAAVAFASPPSPAHADTPSLNEPAPTPRITTPGPDATGPAPGAAAPSLNEPAPTPVGNAGSGASVQRPMRHHHYARAAAPRRRYESNPVGAAARGVVGGVATLGSMAAYPVYCFPRYGSCPLYRPYP